MDYVEFIVILFLDYSLNYLKRRILSKKKKKLEILYKSANYLVINKPHDLFINSSNPENKCTLEWSLREELPWLANARLKNRFYFVHRLDFAVSGLIVLALNKRACAAAAACFQNRTVSKYYLALVRGHIAADMLDVQVPVGWDVDEVGLSNRMSTGAERCVGGPSGMKMARTRLLVIERGIFAPDSYPATKVLMKLETGRRHQLRVHCRHLGHTIVGDYTYSNRRDIRPQRTYLHSFRLALNGLECIDVCTVDPFCDASEWRPVQLVNSLDAAAFTKLDQHCTVIAS